MLYDHLADDPMIQRVIAWGQGRADVRAVLLTSTRARPQPPALDRFSDYDLIVVVRDITPYYEARGWLGDFGEVLVRYRDPIRTLNGHRRFASITQYADWLKIDFTVMAVGYWQHITAPPTRPADLDIGYVVLLDKDDLTADLAAPTYRAYILAPPDEAAYLENIEVFLHEATYVAKNLRRDELLPAKYSFDTVMKGKYLLQMLEWHTALAHNWMWKPGVLGRGLKRDLRPDYWQRLARTYVDADARANWRALFETMALFRDAAVEVGAGLGYAYPQQMHRRLVAMLRTVEP